MAGLRIIKQDGQSTNTFTESRIQQEIVRFYRNKYCLKHHFPRHVIASVPNDGKNYKEQSVKLQTGLMSGFSDLIVIRPNETIYVEVKTYKGKQSPKQIEFENTVTALGFRYIIVRSLEEFKNKI